MKTIRHNLKPTEGEPEERKIIKVYKSDYVFVITFPTFINHSVIVKHLLSHHYNNLQTGFLIANKEIVY